MRHLVRVSLLSIVLFAGQALAGTVITLTAHDAAGEEVARSSIYARGDLLRLDDADVFGRRTSLVFDGTTLVVIDHVGEQFARLDEKILQALRPRAVSGIGAGSELGVDRAGLLTAAEATDREARCAAEQNPVLRENCADSPAVDSATGGDRVRVTARGQSHFFTPRTKKDRNPLRVVEGKAASLDTYDCTWHRVFVGSRKVSALCATPLDSLGDASASAPLFESLSSFMKRMSEAIGRGPLSESDRSPVGLFRETGGLPVLIEHTDRDRDGWTTKLASVDTARLRDELFAPPDDYDEIDLLDPMR